MDAIVSSGCIRHLFLPSDELKMLLNMNNRAGASKECESEVKFAPVASGSSDAF